MGVWNTKWSAMVSSTTPRPAPMCPPVREQTSTIRLRSSSARARSSSRENERRSAGESIRSRRDMAAGNLRGALDGEAGDEVERGGEEPDVVERGAGFVHEGDRAPTRSGDPQQRRIGALLQGRI